MDAAQYLRKSRMEEGMDTEEVLSKHRKALAEYAATHGVHIIETYYEVVSGESLYARPEMLRLLEDVEEGKYDAVLVMDLDRLSRGRMKDQGIILDAFRESGTLIVTPEKTYDLSDDLDDEMAEFKTFMSRREYKIINKRLRRGLRQTIQDGCYVANAPYGYRKVTVDRKPTLEIVEEEAKFVRMMYEMYVDGFGCVSIARHINSLGAKPRRTDAFGRNAVANILKNPTYIGKIVWDQKKHIRKGSKGNPKHITIYQPREQWTIVDGLHPAIVSKELYDKAQAVMAGRYIPASNDGTVRSPLAGLVRCANCGHHMQRMAVGTKQPYLLCNTPGCCAAGHPGPPGQAAGGALGGQAGGGGQGDGLPGGPAGDPPEGGIGRRGAEGAALRPAGAGGLRRAHLPGAHGEGEGPALPPGPGDRLPPAGHPRRTADRSGGAGRPHPGRAGRLPGIRSGPPQRPAQERVRGGLVCQGQEEQAHRLPSPLRPQRQLIQDLPPPSGHRNICL